jgi:hypothetical protein
MDQLTRKEFKEICRVCRDAPICSLTSQSFREVLTERLAGKWPALSSKIAEFTDEQVNTLRGEVKQHFAKNR